jgi:integrase
MRWAEARERHLVQHGPEDPAAPEVVPVPTLQEFVPRFMDGYARANRLKPSSTASKETILRVHLLPVLGDKPLNAIGTEDVQRLKDKLGSYAAKTVNNVLTTLNVVLKVAVDWDVIPRVPCVIKLVRAQKTEASFYDFDAYDRLQRAAAPDPLAYLVVLLGGDAGLRCGEIMALEWRDVDVENRQLCVARAEWEGQVTMPKGGKLRYVPMTTRLTGALRASRHLRSPRVVCDPDGTSLTRRRVQTLVGRVCRRADVKPGVHILRHTFCSHLALRGVPPKAIQGLAGHEDLTTTQRYLHLTPESLVSAIRLLEQGRGEIVEAEPATAAIAGFAG